MLLTAFMNLKIRSLFSASIPLHVSVAEFVFCAVQNWIRSLLRICFGKLYGSFVSDYHKNVSLLQFLEVYKHIFNNSSSIMESIY
jgi:hypothetical protein